VICDGILHLIKRQIISPLVQKIGHILLFRYNSYFCGEIEGHRCWKQSNAWDTGYHLQLEVSQDSLVS
jgi:hypothetical protein